MTTQTVQDRPAPAGRPRRPRRRLSLGALGLVLVLLTVAAVVAVYNKERIGTVLAGGETVHAEFAREYKLTTYRTDVKMSGVVIGTVTGVEQTEHGTSDVTMQIQDSAVELLGDQPTAHIRPTLVLGGAYYVDLVPGGRGTFEGTIPVERTALPVELDKVLGAFTPDARTGMQAAIGQTEATLREGGAEATNDLLAQAPGTLGPAGEVLQGVLGTQPERDLRDVVRGFEHTADVLTRNDGQVQDILASLHGTTAALAAASAPVADSVATLPETLRVTRSGLADLDGTLDRLTTTAESFRPSARELEPLVSQLGPVLRDTRPLLADLRPTLQEARPLVERLVPTAQDTTAVLEDLRGPVLDRLNGPITETVMSPWKGEGPYAGGGNSGHTFYEETAYLVARASYIYRFRDLNGGIARLTPGTGLNAVGGSAVPMSLEQYLETLGFTPPGPEIDAGRGVAVPNPLAEQPGGTR
ncbi:MlaD family protein [Pseudonocardia sp. RS010]|uniref:MlaD family protein n=1 Tax=Pseudonocardia sp. RS010 TaxID=3385979 RepID=UPI00399FB19C